MANRTDYALTAGIFSRSPANIARAAAELRAGNVYINRPITGAVVGRQPFGGFGMSAWIQGGRSRLRGPVPDPRVITENTLRQGFPPRLRDRSLSSDAWIGHGRVPYRGLVSLEASL